jgi:uncharacterized protein (DUF1800 family)
LSIALAGIRRAQPASIASAVTECQQNALADGFRHVGVARLPTLASHRTGSVRALRENTDVKTQPVRSIRPVAPRAARWRAALAAGTLAVVVAACGGGGGSADSGPPPTQTEAARFLAQASFGANDAGLAALSQQSIAGWIADQYNRPQRLHRSYMDAETARLAGTGSIGESTFYESWWQQAVAGDDQLRQRVAFALSQIFVVSFADSNVRSYPRGMASYYDTLGQHAFGNYRQLPEAVTLHPMMGMYLTMMRNQKEDAATGRVPDENYAREVMQLFSIGLHELNADGTLRRDASGEPIETYTHDDISGLAKVFTGWSWYAGPNLTDRTRTRFFGNSPHADRDWQPMQAYNRHAANTDFHSAGEKRFLGTVIPATSAPDPEGDLKIALDTLHNHPNAGPFFGKLLIQRLVTSNPSSGYVARVAAAFANNGSGVRGDMKAVISAILLDPEARTRDAGATGDGKLREPVIRLANFLRAFKATSQTGRYSGIGDTDDVATRLGQTPLRAPSVFNFFRPGYAPPNTTIATAGLVAPELQIAHEVSVAGYLNYMRSSWIPVSTTRDVRQDYSAEIALADDPAALVERANLLLMSGQMTDALRAQIVAAVASRSYTGTNQTSIDNMRRDRVCIAVFLTMASPDYLTQK